MRTSRFGIVRKLWRLPQTCRIEQNVYMRALGLAAFTEGAPTTAFYV
jgi:hypothetical protein